MLCALYQPHLLQPHSGRQSLFPLPGQQAVEITILIEGWQRLAHELQVRVGLEAVDLGRLDEAV